MCSEQVVHLANSLAVSAQCAENGDVVRNRPSDVNREYRMKAEAFALAVKKAYKQVYGRN